jgi:hypothetical protein
MGKATLILVTLAALGLGALVGVSLVDDQETSASTVNRTAPASTGGAPIFRYLSPEDVAAEGDVGAKGAPYTDGENFVAEEMKWRSETIAIDLPPDGRVEYKVFMSQGDSFVFNWSVEGEEVYYDFHAHDEAFGDGFFTRYEAGRATQRSGAIVAPYKGQHGWYWQNLEPDAAVITLEVAGFFDEIVKIDLERK